MRSPHDHWLPEHPLYEMIELTAYEGPSNPSDVLVRVFPTIRCSDRRRQDCIAEGQSIVDCLRENPGYGGGDDMPGPENDDLRDRLGRSRGVAGAYLDTTPMAAVFIAFCREGVEQFCRGGQF